MTVMASRAFVQCKIGKKTRINILIRDFSADFDVKLAAIDGNAAPRGGQSPKR
jgi:hypothetical protein